MINPRKSVKLESETGMIKQLLLDVDFTIPTESTYYVVTVYRHLFANEKDTVKQASVFYFTKSQENLAKEVFNLYTGKRQTVILSIRVQAWTNDKFC